MFKGKVAVITGGASGIGKSIALALAKLGTDIVIADIDNVPIEKVSMAINSMGRRVLGVHCDVSHDSDVKILVDQTLSNMGKVDFLVNNAGVYLRGYLEKLKIEDWEWILGINVLGIVRCVNAFLPHMLSKGNGYIINTASVAGFIPSEPPNALKNIHYSTSKFAVVGFSEGLYAYLSSKGIKVSVLCPGYVSTNLLKHSRYVGDNSKELDDIKQEDEITFTSPGVIRPDEVAQALIEGIKNERFLIITPNEVESHLMNRGQDLEKLEKYLQTTFKVFRMKKGNQ